MPQITQKSTKPPRLKLNIISHGTLETRDLQASRRFYEEVMGFEVLQRTPVALLLRLGSDHTYVVVETRTTRWQHGVFSFSVADPDDNWWEILANRPRGYALAFDEPEADLTGRANLTREQLSGEARRQESAIGRPTVT